MADTTSQPFEPDFEAEDESAPEDAAPAGKPLGGSLASSTPSDEDFQPAFGDSAAGDRPPGAAGIPRPPGAEPPLDDVLVRVYFPHGAAPPQRGDDTQPFHPIKRPPAPDASSYQATPFESLQTGLETIDEPPWWQSREKRPPVLLLALIAGAILIVLGGGLLILSGMAPNPLNLLLGGDSEPAAGAIERVTTATPIPVAAVDATEEPAEPTEVIFPTATDLPTATATATEQPTEAPTQASTEEPTEAVAGVAGAAMVPIPGGTFEMGGSGATRAHDVAISAYSIDRTEVTNAQYAECVADGGCEEPASTLDYSGDPYYGIESLGNYPVIRVTWAQADAYCRWRGARLPTEAEWEMAARWNPASGVQTLYPWGDEWMPEALNFCDASCLLDERDESIDDGYPEAAPVGSFPEGASAAGMLDMAGNVAEWVADWYDPGYYADSPAEDPAGPDQGEKRVVRGGAWGIADPEVFRSTVRSSFAPDVSGPGIGFRCAASQSTP